jgi:hypothetical protein
MENTNQNSFLKSTMNYGAMLGLAIVVYSLLLWMLGQSLSKSLGYVTYLIMIAGIYLGLKFFRDQDSGGFLTYGRALGAGTMIVLFSSVITAFYTYIMFKFLDPGLIEKMMLMAEEQLYERGMADEQIEVAVKAQAMFMKPGVMAIMGLVGSVFMGFIFTLIIAIFVKKDPTPFDQTS